MALFRIGLSQKGIVILFQGAVFRAAICRFAAFAVVEIQRQVAAGVLFQAPVATLATVDKKCVSVHFAKTFS